MNTKEEYIKNLTTYHGFSEPTLLNKQYEEIVHLYEHIQKDRIHNIIEYMHEEHLSEGEEKARDTSYLKTVWAEIKAKIKEPRKIYEIFGKLLKEYEYDEILEIFSVHTRDPQYNKIFKMFRVKFREFQEEMLAHLESICKNFPDEELYNISKLFQSKRDDVEWLKSYVDSLTQQQNVEKAQHLASFKQHILKSYFEEKYKEEYKEYVNNVMIKKNLIEEILKNSQYKKSELYKKSIDDLQYIKEFEAKSADQLKNERNLTKEYIKKFDKVIYDSEHVKFNKLINDAKDSLNDEVLNRIISYYEEKNTEFALKLKLAFSTIK